VSELLVVYGNNERKDQFVFIPLTLRSTYVLLLDMIYRYCFCVSSRLLLFSNCFIFRSKSLISLFLRLSKFEDEDDSDDEEEAARRLEVDPFTG